MLNRYQTGPLVTVLFIASALALCGFGVFDALRFYCSSSFTSVSAATKTS
jgi:hypothetical protein